MKRQVLIIHGGHVFDSYADYLEYLKNYKIDSLADLKFKDWKYELEESLSEQFEVIRPQLPCKRNAKYKEWVIWLEKLFPFLRNNIILIGHSLGGTFWLKYLAENDFPVKISQLHLVAAAVSEELCDFVLPQNLNKICEQVKNVYFYYSEDDPIVPFSDLQILSIKLTCAHKITFTDRGHFRLSSFPELKNNILLS